MLLLVLVVLLLRRACWAGVALVLQVQEHLPPQQHAHLRLQPNPAQYSVERMCSGIGEGVELIPVRGPAEPRHAAHVPELEPLEREDQHAGQVRPAEAHHLARRLVLLAGAAVHLVARVQHLLLRVVL